MSRDELIEKARECPGMAYWHDDEQAVVVDFCLPLLAEAREEGYMLANKTAYDRGFTHGRRAALEEAAHSVRAEHDSYTPHIGKPTGVGGYDVRELIQGALSTAEVRIRALARETDKPEAGIHGSPAGGAVASPVSKVEPVKMSLRENYSLKLKIALAVWSVIALSWMALLVWLVISAIRWLQRQP